MNWKVKVYLENIVPNFTKGKRLNHIPKNGNLKIPFNNTLLQSHR